MRLKRAQNDFRVFEILDEDFLSAGSHRVYRITKRGTTTFEAADALARAAGVPREAVQYAGLKDREGITGQYMSIEGGPPLEVREEGVTIRTAGAAPRGLESTDSRGNSFEIVVRDLESRGMVRLRRNLAELKESALPAYFDDQRFGCLRHGQGFVVRKVALGDLEGAAKDLLCAPSKFGPEQIEQQKERIRRHWGDWERLLSMTRGRRGASLFEHLVREPNDWEGALVRGIATRERTIHLFAYQSFLWNEAVRHWLAEQLPEEEQAWLPGDAGPLLVPRTLPEEFRADMDGATFPLYGEGVELTEEQERCYSRVFREERLDPAAFRDLDISGFRPQAEARALWSAPEHLRAAPAERDDLHRGRQKMRVRFRLPRGQYATLLLKRLGLPMRDDEPFFVSMHISRHRLDYPGHDGKPAQKPDWKERDKKASRGQQWPEVGSHVSGKVTGFTDWGLFLNIGLPKDAVVAVDDMPALDVELPLSERFQKGQPLTATVVLVDRRKERVRLSLLDDAKPVVKTGWKDRDDRGTRGGRWPDPGSVVSGNVVGFSDWGVFVNIGLPKDAVVAVEDMPALDEELPLRERFQKGQPLSATVILVDRSKERVRLSLLPDAKPVEVKRSGGRGKRDSHQSGPRKGGRPGWKSGGKRPGGKGVRRGGEGRKGGQDRRKPAASDNPWGNRRKPADRGEGQGEER